MKANPFTRPIVDDPRDVTRPVEAINRAALDQVLGLFQDLENQAVPRLKPGPLTVPLISFEPGAGKSHLVGRLWHHLDARATLIYLRGNQDRFNLWTWMLDRLVQELEYPKKCSVLSAGRITQFDDLIRHVFAELIPRVIHHAQQTGDTTYDEVLTELRADPVRFLEREGVQEWLQDWLPDIAQVLEDILADARLTLNEDATTWVSVLFNYMTHPRRSPQRQAAVDWVRGSTLDEEDLVLIGCKLSHNPAANETEEERNELSFRRVADLCFLASFYRPFLFAFDQTELYNGSPELARAFGAQLSRIQGECRNQLTLITANEGVWREGLLTSFELADQQRFHPEIHIVGATQEQAADLVGAKMHAVGYEFQEIKDFLSRGWLEHCFAKKTAVPAREVEQKACEQLIKWDSQVVQPGPSGEFTPSKLDELYHEYRDRLLATDRATDFDAAVLDWCFREGFAGVEGLEIVSDFRSQRGRVHALWRVGSRSLAIIIEDKTHHRCWEAIFKDLQAVQEKEKASGRTCLALGIWHPANQQIRAGTQKRMDAVPTFRLAQLARSQFAELYAGHAIYADIAQGAFPHLDKERLLRFLGQQWAGWLPQLTENQTAPKGKPRIEAKEETLQVVLREVVQRLRMALWPMVKEELEKNLPGVTLDQVLLACSEMNDEIKVCSTPNNHLFLWKVSST
ncbi:MAG: hypothetical protein ACFCU3_05655 [Verrucomicrobiales bacterium]